MPTTIYTQLTLTEATNFKDLLNAGYENAEIIGDITAVQGQNNNYFTATIPTARVAEFDAADIDKKNNFALFTARAQGPAYQGVDLVTAWETEYAKIY